MKKLTIFVFALASLNWFVLSVDDPIGDYIKTYRVKKIREIASQKLMMLASDKQKYLDQLAQMKQEIKRFKEESKTKWRARPPQGHHEFALPYIVRGVFYEIITILGIAAASGVWLHTPDHEGFKLPFIVVTSILTGVSGICCYNNFRKVTFVVDSMYIKIIMMEVLLESIPVVTDNEPQKEML